MAEKAIPAGALASVRNKKQVNGKNKK